MIKDIPRLPVCTVLGNFLDIQPRLTSYNIIVQLEQTKSLWRTCGRVIWELNTSAASSAYPRLSDDLLTEVSTLPSDTIGPVLTCLNQYPDDKPGGVKSIDYLDTEPQPTRDGACERQPPPSSTSVI